ncbi:hypothetical protein HanXRQr2_Chr06g0242281 [Helianthus annuus]|uniref:Uncharacterized protein n=1 Tax=Helianthus annuus TaxID=4232 RepID=A0A251UFB7_HELAN|nr:hypothetical protein HanXRQr2_Chr06g0242281 [Helianthus annuus]
MTKTEDGCGVCCSRQPPFPWREESIDSDSCILEIRRRQDDRRDYMSSLQPGISSVTAVVIKQIVRVDKIPGNPCLLHQLKLHPMRTTGLMMVQFSW